MTLDAKGRLAIPTRYRERIQARCDGALVATVDKDYCLLIYPYPDWEEIERKLVRLPSLNSAGQEKGSDPGALTPYNHRFGK